MILARFFVKNRKFDDQFETIEIMKNFEKYHFLQSKFFNNPFYSKFYTDSNEKNFFI